MSRCVSIGSNRSQRRLIRKYIKKISTFCLKILDTFRVPVATNTGHWKNYVYGKATAVCFLYDTRLRFLVDGADAGKGAPMSCALIYWGENYKRFFDIFIRYGAVVNIDNLRDVKIGKHDKTHQLELAVSS